MKVSKNKAWIIVLSIIGGTILLSLIIYGVFKMNNQDVENKQEAVVEPKPVAAMPIQENGNGAQYNATGSGMTQLSSSVSAILTTIAIVLICFIVLSMLFQITRGLE